MMKIHHLNCGTMHMPGAPLVCHVLLLETNDGLVLVDTGFGLHDIADPAGRIGPYRSVTRPVLVEEQTALRQVQARGFSAEDVHHIILTHGDSDHAGGIADFPHATIHVGSVEERAILTRPTWFERQRYSHKQWEHRPTLVGHAPGDENWQGFEGARRLDDIAPELMLVPLYGHTKGHCGVAIKQDEGWLLHAGDSFYHPGTLDPTMGRPPLSLRLQETAFAADRDLLRQNQRRLSHLRDDPDTNITIINAHDPNLLATATTQN